MAPTGGDAAFVQLWQEHRPFLVDLAFRMLGNIGDAEDVVQDAFTRLWRSEVGDVADYRGWLVVVTSRLCLDLLRSARVRHGARTPVEDLAADSPRSARAVDPADRITLDDTVRTALLVLLEELSPGERAVFVLHDVFRYPFDEVASIVGRSADSCRKLASRARRRVETAGGLARFTVEPAEHHAIAERFIAACAGGDMTALVDLLHADVAGVVDMGAGTETVPAQIGRDRVSHNLLRFFGPSSGITLVSHPLNGGPGVMAFRDGRLYAVLILEVDEERIRDIHASLNPLTLGPIGELVDARR